MVDVARWAELRREHFVRGVAPSVTVGAGDLGGDKPLVLVRDTAADLRGKLRRAEVSLVDRVDGAVGQAAVLNPSADRVGAACGFDHDDAACHSARLRECARRVAVLKVAVDTTRRGKIER